VVQDKMNKNSSLQRQQGVALITVLLVVALVVIIAANMTGRLQLLMSRSINAQMSQQGLWSTIAGEQLVFNVLEQDYKDDSQSVNLAQLWAREGMVFPLNEGALSGEIRDLNSCFNLNALATAQTSNTQQRTLAQRQFEILLQSLNVEDYSAELLSYTVKDWVDSDDRVNGSFGAEDSTYAGKVVPYIAANGLMADVSELLAIEGVTSSIYRKIKSHVCVLPTTENKINVNTIKEDDANILVALFESKLDLSDAKTLISSRDNEGFKSIDDFFSSTEITAMGTVNDDIKQQFDITSSNFSATLVFTVEEQNFTLNTNYHRDTQGKLHIVSRRIGRDE